MGGREHPGPGDARTGPTSRTTFVETKRRELNLQLERCQAEIGRLNKELREHKARQQSGQGETKLPELKGAKPKERERKLCPFKDDPEYPIYFVLAARDVLAPKLYAEVERTAKALMHDAFKMGVEEGEAP